MDTSRFRGHDLGRGPVATADMKARIAALRADGRDILHVLWTRHVHALAGDGYAYEHYTGPTPHPVHPGRARSRG